MKELLKKELIKIRNNYLKSMSSDLMISSLKNEYPFLDLENILISKYQEYLDSYFSLAEKDSFLNSVIIASEQEVDFLLNFDYFLYIFLSKNSSFHKYIDIKFEKNNLSFYQNNYFNKATSFQWGISFKEKVDFYIKNKIKTNLAKNSISDIVIFNLLVSFLSQHLMNNHMEKYQIIKKYVMANKEIHKITYSINKEKLSQKIINTINFFNQPFNLSSVGDNSLLLLAINKECNLLYDCTPFDIEKYSLL